jgi:hypothetical protein
MRDRESAVKDKTIAPALVCALALALLVLATLPLFKSWIILLPGPAIFGYYVGYRWPDLGAARYLRTGLILGFSTWIFYMTGRGVIYPELSTDARTYFYGLVRLGIGLALLTAGPALVGDMAARKKITLDKAIVASAISLIGAIVGLLTELAK